MRYFHHWCAFLPKMDGLAVCTKRCYVIHTASFLYIQCCLPANISWRTHEYKFNGVDFPWRWIDFSAYCKSSHAVILIPFLFIFLATITVNSEEL